MCTWRWTTEALDVSCKDIRFHSQLATVELMYDSSRKIVSSTWFSAESNLEGKRTTVRIIIPTDKGKKKTNCSIVSCSYLLTWSRKESSCCLSGAVIISSTSVSCSGSAPLACRDARMASIRWDFSSRRLSIKQRANQLLICDTVFE